MIERYILNLKQLHGNFIFYKDYGLIFVGPSGCGKSMLSFQLIQKGAQLISDDIIDLSIQPCDNKAQKTPQKLYGQSPDLAFGYMEIFGLGIIKLPKVQIKKRAPIHHIFIHHHKPPRLLEEQPVCLLNISLKASYLNFSNNFASDYINAFYNYPRKNFL